MSFRARQTAVALTLLALGATAAHAQYSTPVGTGVAKPKTLRATAVLEWTGAIEKPNASRLIPLAVWDGEHYQPGGLYLARPEPLALESGTQYELERSGDVIGLYNVRGAGEVNGIWEGLGRFQAEAPPPPPKKLKPSKVLPVLSNGKPDTGASTSTATADSGKPTLHRKSDSSDSTGNTSAPAPSPQTAGSSTTSTAGDSGGPTLHRHSDDASSTAPEADSDRPTLHKHSEVSADDDPDRPTLHRVKSGADAAASIDPDRPRLRYGGSGEQELTMLPARLIGMPPNMQQVVGISDSTVGELRSYQYKWPDPGDAAKMQAALAAIAARAIVQPAAAPAKPGAQFGPAAHAKRTAAHKAKPAAPPAPALVDEHFAAFELTFSGGATLVYSAHTADEGPKRVWVTIIAQPDFNGVPQVLLQQVAHGDRLDETPWMQLIDAVDTDNDQRAELVFQLNGASVLPPADTAAAAPAPYDGPGDANAVAAAAAANAAAAASRAAAAASAKPIPEREFAIYRVAGGKAVQVFDTGPLP